MGFMFSGPIETHCCFCESSRRPDPWTTNSERPLSDRTADLLRTARQWRRCADCGPSRPCRGMGYDASGFYPFEGESSGRIPQIAPTQSW